MALLKSNEETINHSTQHTGWLVLGSVLYSWSDRRLASVDRNWWRMERPQLPGWVPAPAVIQQIAAHTESSLPMEDAGVIPDFELVLPPAPAMVQAPFSL